MTKTSACLAGLAFALLALPAVADADPRSANVVTLKPVDIIGQRRVPVASIDVSTAAHKLQLPELRHTVIDGVDQAVRSAPF